MPTHPLEPGDQWPRLIAHVDLDAFFASIEQQDQPHLRGRPVAVTNGAQGTTIITSSYEARAYGVKTGMRLREARQLCPALIQAPSRPGRYVEVSARILDGLESITPDVEVFSVDEAWLDLTHVQSYHASDAATLGARIQAAVADASGGLTCSVGLADAKLTAKWGSKQRKPAGVFVIPPGKGGDYLADAPVTDLCGIAKGIGGYLAERGVYTCGQMANLPMAELGRRFGRPGRRLWLAAQGRDPEPVSTKVAAPKSLGHGKVLPPRTRSRRVVATFLQHMVEMLARRMRRHGLQAQHFQVSWLTDQGWRGAQVRSRLPTDDSRTLWELAKQVLVECWRDEDTFQVHVLATDPRPASRQPDLFEAPDPKRDQLNAMVDAIGERFGEYAICPAPLLGRSQMPQVISPAWRPGSARATINPSQGQE